MKFSGKNVVRSYANWFGVDLLCAVKELSLCGVAVDPAYVAQFETTFASRSSRRRNNQSQNRSQLVTVWIGTRTSPTLRAERRQAFRTALLGKNLRPKRPRKSGEPHRA